MTEPTLPPLPVPDSQIIEARSEDYGLPFEQRSPTDYFTADQMREYGRLCAEQERERAARVCDELMIKDVEYLPDLPLLKARYYGLREATVAIRAKGK